MSMHPYRAVWTTRDLSAWAETLAFDVVLHSPIILAPFRGRAAAVELFEVLLETLDGFDIRHEYAENSRRHAFLWSATVSGRTIEGTDFITIDENGRVSEIRVLIRPLVSIGAFAAAIGPPLASRRSSFRGVMARILIAPLRVVLAVADRASTRLVH